MTDPTEDPVEGETPRDPELELELEPQTELQTEPIPKPAGPVNLQQELKGILRDSLDGIALGVQKDLERYAAALATDAARAVTEGRPELAEEIYEQALALAELHRVRVADESTRALRQTIQAVVRTGVAVLSATLAP